MASDKEFVEYVVGQMCDAGPVTFKKMFGEYAVYCDGKVVALVCDNCLYIKPTEGGRRFIENVVEASPYAGAKPYFLIGDQMEDRKWIGELVRITAQELPAPKLKRKKVRGESK
ncbi:MAG: TfoX/Sxy family protein [Fibrobacterota bacterium]